MGYRFVLADGSIGTAQLANDAVTEAKIANGSIAAADIGTGEICGAHILGAADFEFPYGIGVVVDGDLTVCYGEVNLQNSNGLILPGQGPSANGALRFYCGAVQFYCGGSWRSLYS